MSAIPFKIFISSPGDVTDERRRATRVINRLRLEFSHLFAIEPVLWEDEPMLASGHFQDIITKPSATDIVVVILWSRLGTLLPDHYKGMDGRSPVTGTEWEFEEALQARQKSGDKPAILLYRKDEDPVVTFKDSPDIDGIKEQWEALNAFWGRHFQKPTGEFVRAFHRFTQLDAFEKQLEEHLRELIRRRIPAGTAGKVEWHGESPFLGLKAFTGKHAEIFFGRERAKKEVLDRFARRVKADSPFLLVLGPSGAGKSSLIQAGVVPQLTTPGMVSGVISWRIATFRPTEAGGNLWTGLARVVLAALPELKHSGNDEQLGALWKQSPESGKASTRQTLHGNKSQERLLLVIDQMEELFTLTAVTDQDREDWCALLHAWVRSGVVWMFATMRGDFYHLALAIPQLRELVDGDGHYYLGPPDKEEYRRMIQRPVEMAGVTFGWDDEQNNQVDELILEEAVGAPGSLPLLEFLLDELYRKDADPGRVLTLGSYRELGGLKGVIARQAEGICWKLKPTDQDALPSVLRQLVTIHPADKTVVARVAKKQEIATTPERESVLDLLVDGRLVVTSGDDNNATARLAHETLLKEWSHLKEVIAQDSAFLEARDRLESECAVWQAKKEDTSFLLPGGSRLIEAAGLLSRREDLKPDVIRFIDASIARDRHTRNRRARRAWGVAGVMAVLAVVASGFAWHAFRQESEAQQARVQAEEQGKRADVARSEAEELVRFMIFGLRDRLEHLGRLDLLDQAARKALAYFERLGEVSKLSTMQQRNLMVSLSAVSDVLQAQGNLQEALTGYRKAMEITRGLVDQAPGDTDYQRDLSVSHNRIGDVLSAQGDLSGALSAYREGMEIAKRLAAQDPGNAGWQRDLSVSHNKIGDVLSAQGDLSGALSAYREDLEIAKRLAAQDPGNTVWQRDLSMSHNRIGDVLSAQGDLSGASAVYREGMEIAKRLAAQDPGNAGWQRDLSVSHNKIGDVLSAQGDLSGALSAYREGMEIAKRLAAQDPGNAGWQRDLAISHERMAIMSEKQGNRQEAIDHFRREIEIVERFYAKFPDQKPFRYNLDFARSRLNELLRQTEKKQKPIRKK
ncbi:MAG: hypothetical protein HQM03_19580 [Magnetococcales bacterium]|nr:hypothetical protein [Magnetococcales bacterium]